MPLDALLRGLGPFGVFLLSAALACVLGGIAVWSGSVFEAGRAAWRAR